MDRCLLLLPTFLSLLRYVCGAAACFPPDRLALRQFAAFSLLQNRTISYGGIIQTTTTTTFTGWEGDECCSWHGVVCNSGNHTAAARISKLLLSNQNLTGAIPEATCSLSALSTLDLSNNYLSIGSIPTCFAHNLTNLRHLNLSHNILKGTIPKAICSLSGLSTLDLSRNELSGSIPTCFAHNLTNLRHLDLSDNWDVNGTMLPVSALPHLAYLDLSNNNLNSIPPFQAPRLRWLLLRGIAVYESSIPIFTNGTPNLQYLDLGENHFRSGISNLFIFPLLQLQHLDLSDCWGFSEEIPVTAIISQVPRLRTLFLSYTSLAAEGPQISELLCGLKYLEKLSLASDPLNDELVSNVVGEMPQPANCKSPSLDLAFLDLSNNKLRGPLPAWLSRFSNLQVLVLFGNNFNSCVIPTEWQNLTHLTVLQLSGPTSFNSSFLLPQPLPLFRLPLQTLTLSSLGLANRHIPCSQLSLLNATLQNLDLSNNHLTGGHVFHCLAQNNFTSLAFLDLSQNALAFNLGLINPPSLSMGLNLASCQLHGELTDQFVGMLRSIGTDKALIDRGEQPYISLAHNSLCGTLPLGIGTVVDVEVLDLSHNDFTGRIPPSLGNMSYLWQLYLGNNHLEGEVPRELGNRSFSALFLGKNNLTKWHPATYYSDIVDLSYNRLEGDLEWTFFHHHSLVEAPAVLLLGHNRLSGAIPHILFNDTIAASLSIIQLCDNHLTGTIPHTLFKLFPSLTLDTPSYVEGVSFENTFTLVVKNLELSYDYRSEIFTYLDLSNNKLNGSIPESLGQLSRLRYLNLSRNQLTGNIPSSLSNLSLLEFLDMSYNRLQGSLPSSLSKLTKLEVFNVSFNEELIGHIPTNSPQLEDNTSYIGDPKLCGDPYLQRCPDMGANILPPPKEDHEIEESESVLMKWIDEWIAIPGFCLGILLGFLGALWVLRLISFI